MKHVKVGIMSKCLAVSQALLVRASDLDTNASIYAATRGERAFFNHGRPAESRMTVFQFPQRAEQALWGPLLL